MTFQTRSGLPATPPWSEDHRQRRFDKLYALTPTTVVPVMADNWFWATPVVRDGTVYAASLDGNVYAVDAESGDDRWQRPFDAGSPVRSTPVVASEGLVVAARSGEVFKLDLESGDALEGSPAETGDEVLADLATDDAGIVYVMPTNDTLYLVNTAEGLPSAASCRIEAT
jgi:outer membrane protein assembly factor BamB